MFILSLPQLCATTILVAAWIAVALGRRREDAHREIIDRRERAVNDTFGSFAGGPASRECGRANRPSMLSPPLTA